MYKIYGILRAEYPCHDYHRASGAKPLVGGQGAKPPEAKSNFRCWMSCGSGNIMALGGGGQGTCPLCPPPRGSTNVCISVLLKVCANGGILPPSLFMFDICDLIGSMIGLNTGCDHAGLNASLLAYANHPVLLARPWRTLQSLKPCYKHHTLQHSVQQHYKLS